MTSTSEKPIDRAQMISVYVGRKIAAMQRRYLAGSTGQASRELAQLRRAIQKKPGATPEVWSIEFQSMPEELMGRTADPSPGEWAVHVALTLYAVHQQSLTGQMYVSGLEHDFGHAVRQLVDGGYLSSESDGEELGMPHRFAAMVTAQSMGELCHFARQIVSQLRAASIPVDYSRLARQLYWFQFETTRDQTCLEWARSFSDPLRVPDGTSGESDERISEYAR